ncbi:hypothetical protein N1I87_06970 [Bacillus sp. FSL W8-0102]|uniref:hypothetical protein n=1 Tax=Bacillus sp. FSL W8-0102 TaxID=2978205 RepID=UPI0030F87571
MRKLLISVLLLTTVFFLDGCMFPDEEKAENKVPYQEQIQSVQKAVEQFQKQNGGILPIQTKDENVPIYQKYLIDFKKLVPQYLPEPPGNSYENGRIFQYVLLDVEKKPVVKIFDLRIAETIRELEIRIQSHGYPPFKKEIAPNVYTLDYKKLGYKEEPMVTSPYSQKNLPLVITGDGKIYVDYRMDLYEALKNNKHIYKPGEDIRPLLTQHSFFVPAYSLPYTVNEKNEPVFMKK